MIQLIIWDKDDTLFDTTGQLNNSYEKLSSITLFPGVKEILECRDYRHALVTKGDEIIQNQKIDILGVRNVFSDIHICRAADDKFIAFQTLLSKYHITNPQQVVVIGNRIDEEIAFGNSLGCTTVHFAHGKHAKLTPQNSYEYPQYSIQQIEELMPLLRKLHV